MIFSFKTLLNNEKYLMVDDGRESVLDSNKKAGNGNEGIVLKRVIFIRN